jgi:hypothetical protein
MPTPEITIIVVPRERFQFAQESLDSLYEHTTLPFKLIYVDNHSPAKLRQHLIETSTEKGFQLIHSERFLSPNAARNLGLKQVTTPYVVFERRRSVRSYVSIVQYIKLFIVRAANICLLLKWKSL